MNDSPGPDRSISVVVPALNEEGNLEAAVDAVRAALRGRFAAHEILLIDDGSTDRTGALAERLAAGDPAIRAFHNGVRRGLGYSYRRGVEEARCEYVVMVPGDNEIPGESLERMFHAVGSADIIAPYFVNTWVRPWSRRLLSKTFTALVSLLVGVRLHYYNGPCIHRRDLVLAALPETSGFAYMAVLLARLIRSGYSVAEVGVLVGQRAHGRSKAFTLTNVLSIGATLAGLFVELRILRRRWGRRPAVGSSVP